jgi:PAS domain S-box-containing protein
MFSPFRLFFSIENGMRYNDSRIMPVKVALRIAILIFIALLAGAGNSVAADPPADQVPTVVILNSYHQGYEWSDGEIEGLLARLKAVHPGMSPVIEHLDLKRFSGEDYENRLRGFLAGKYRDQRIDLAVILDNPAFDLILSHRDEILPSVPIVFAGVNNFTPVMLKGQNRITGVAEVQDYQETLFLALALQPGIRRVLAVHDYTATGRAVRREMEAVLPAFRDRVQVTFNAPATFEETAAQIAVLPPDSLVLILSFVTDSAGKVLPPDQSTAVLAAQARVPVYAMHETRLGHGIVGGMLIGGAEHGRRAAALALRVLAGVDPASIPVETRSTSRPMFDYVQLKRFHVSLDALPTDSILVNRPVSFYEQHKTVLWGAACIFALLLGLIGCLLVLLQRKNKAERALRESEERYRQVVDIIPDSIAMFVDERFAFVNASTMELLGAESSDQLIGRPIWDFCHPAYHSLGQERFRQCQEGEKPLPMAEFELIRLDGQVRTVESAAVPIVYKSRRAVLAAWRDISARRQAEKDLRESEARYRIVADNTYDWEYWVDPQGRFLYVSPSCKRISGYSAEEFMKRADLWCDIILPEDKPKWDAHSCVATHQQQAEEIEFRIQRADGEVRWISHVCRPVFDPKGPFLGSRGSNRDITERMQMEVTLRESEVRFRALVECAPDAICVQSAGRFVYLNSAACRLFGASRPEDLLGKDFMERTVPECRDNIRERIRFQRETGKPSSLMDQKYLRLDGTQVPVETTAVSIRYHGEDAHMVLIRDITARKQAEETLRDSEERHRRIVEASSDAFLLRSKEIIIYANPAALKLFRANHTGDLIGKRYLDLVHPDDRALSAERVKKSTDENWIAPRREHRLLALDGQVVHVESTGMPIKYRGETQHFGVFRDISERKRVDHEKEQIERQLRQAQKMEAIGTLAGGIAHDFNNILSVIVGNAEILGCSTSIDDSSRGGLNQILAASQRATQLVRQILAFSRHGKQEKILIDVKPIVKETLEFLRASLPTSIQLRHYLDPDTGTIMADPTQMQQVLMNLCTNAGHAMEKEGGSLQIKLSNTAVTEEDVHFDPEVEPGNYVKLTVSDTGHGMEPSVLQRIFEPYFTTKEPGKGTGLGLAVVHGIVKSHGGKIKVYSEVGKGTTFTMFFPRAMGFEKVEDKPMQPLSMGTEKILFVDDEEALTDLGRQILGELGYQVETRTSPIEALEAFRANPQKFDLVITDMTMPQMTGLNLARKIMEIRPGMPIILCIGFSEQAHEQAAGAMGIRAFLYKPLLMRDIADAVRKALNPNMSDMQ